MFDATTNYAASEEAVGAIFDNKPNKRKEDAPAEGSNSKTEAPAKKQKRGNKGKKPVPLNQCGQGQAEDSDEAFVASPDRKGRRGDGDLFNDMLKKLCPYHKGSVNHTLEQCEMLRKYNSRVAHRNEDKKKDADDKGGDSKFPSVENVFFIFEGPVANMTARLHKRERREVMFAVGPPKMKKKFSTKGNLPSPPLSSASFFLSLSWCATQL